MKAVFDSNIIIDYFNGIDSARQELSYYENVTISIITWMEAVVGAKTEREEKVIRRFLQTLTVHHITIEIAERAVKFRKQFRMRLPDAIIRATAEELGQILVTRNTRDYPVDHPGIRVPYQL